jgi:hypothetical protein
LDIFLVIWLIGILTTWPVWFWIVISSRRKRGEPIIPKPPVNSQLCERRVSGAREGAIFAHAANCLLVCVFDGILWVTLTFPFNLIAPYGLSGLDHRVALRDVKDVELKKGLFGRTVRLRIAPSGGKSTTLILRFKEPEEFLAALRALPGR